MREAGTGGLASPRVAHGAEARIGLRAGGELAVELCAERPAAARAAGTVAKAGNANAHCDFWDRTPLLWPHVQPEHLRAAGP